MGRGLTEAELVEAAQAFAMGAREAGAPVQRMVAALKRCMDNPRAPISRAESYKSREIAFRAALNAYFGPNY